MYAPPRTPRRARSGMTWRYDDSLEIRLSVSKYPFGSDSRAIVCAKGSGACARHTEASASSVAAFRRGRRTLGVPVTVNRSSGDQEQYRSQMVPPDPDLL